MAQSDKQGAFIHGYTYAGHPVAASVALETLKIYEEMDLLGHIASVEPVFRREIGALVDHSMVGNFNSIGLIGGIEIVQDKATKQDWPAGANLTMRLDAHARANGLILRITGNRVAFSPPLIISAEEIRELARRLRLTLDATHAELLAL
jgi:4-aminobutyrate--pyruvate transaminase